jgi:hypothetical protein
MPIPIVFSSSFSTWRFHSHFVRIKYTTRGPIGKNVVSFGLFSCFLSQPHFERSGMWESSGILENSKHNCRGQNTLHWGVLYTVGKVLKCRCPKWPCMNHLDICNTSYGWKKGQEPNWQFDSRPLKVGNWLDPGVYRWNVTHPWKALKENYKFFIDFVPIGGWSEKLWTPKVPGVQTGTISGLHFGSLGKKCHSDASASEKHKKYYMGEGGGFPWVRAVVSQVSRELPVACPSTRVFQNVI